MSSFPDADVPISHEDRAEILAIFIGLMRALDQETLAETENAKRPLFDPPSNPQDLRSQWGL